MYFTFTNFRYWEILSKQLVLVVFFVIFLENNIAEYFRFHLRKFDSYSFIFPHIFHESMKILHFVVVTFGFHFFLSLIEVFALFCSFTIKEQNSKFSRQTLPHNWILQQKTTATCWWLARWLPGWLTLEETSDRQN